MSILDCVRTRRINEFFINDYVKLTMLEQLGPCPEAIKLFFMLNSVEHEILNAHKYKNIKKFGGEGGLGSYNPRMLLFPLINVKMPTTVGILTCMSWKFHVQLS